MAAGSVRLGIPLLRVDVEAARATAASISGYGVGDHHPDVLSGRVCHDTGCGAFLFVLNRDPYCGYPANLPSDNKEIIGLGQAHGSYS